MFLNYLYKSKLAPLSCVNQISQKNKHLYLWNTCLVLYKEPLWIPLISEIPLTFETPLTWVSWSSSFPKSSSEKSKSNEFDSSLILLLSPRASSSSLQCVHKYLSHEDGKFFFECLKGISVLALQALGKELLWQMIGNFPIIFFKLLKILEILEEI